MSFIFSYRLSLWSYEIRQKPQGAFVGVIGKVCEEFMTWLINFSQSQRPFTVHVES